MSQPSAPCEHPRLIEIHVDPHVVHQSLSSDSYAAALLRESPINLHGHCCCCCHRVQYSLITYCSCCSLLLVAYACCFCCASVAVAGMWSLGNVVESFRYGLPLGAGPYILCCGRGHAPSGCTYHTAFVAARTIRRSRRTISLASCPLSAKNMPLVSTPI